jgi:hypothetical protein
MTSKHRVSEKITVVICNKHWVALILGDQEPKSRYKTALSLKICSMLWELI